MKNNIIAYLSDILIFFTSKMLNVNSWINCAAKGNIMALKESL